MLFVFAIYIVYNDYINLKKSIDYQECRTVPITEPLLTGILFLYLWIVFLLFFTTVYHINIVHMHGLEYLYNR